MIIKSFEINKKKKFDNQHYFLVYGENEGLKSEIVQILKENFLGKIETVDESQILNNTALFHEKLLNKSLFEKEKTIIINRCTEKIYDFIEVITEKYIPDIKIILNANIL